MVDSHLGFNLLFPNHCNGASMCVRIYTSLHLLWWSVTFPSPLFLSRSVLSFLCSFYLDTEEPCVGMGCKTGKCIKILPSLWWLWLSPPVGSSAELPLLGHLSSWFWELYSLSPCTWACRDFVDLHNDEKIHAILSQLPLTLLGWTPCQPHFGCYDRSRCRAQGNSMCFCCPRSICGSSELVG